MDLRKVTVGMGVLVVLLVLAACVPITAPTPTLPEVLVPEAPETVANIVAENCSDCHTALPADHTEDKNIDQCGSCHVPYGNVEKPSHDETRDGCTECHETPAETHFYLRDEEDQTVFASDAEEKCIACHRDGGHQTDGRGFPPLETNEDIAGALQKGTLRQWIQPGGFMAKYVSEEDVATLTAWIDEVTADRPLAYDPVWTAAYIDSDFEINGLGDNPVWDSAPEHDVALTPTIFTDSDVLKLKAVYSDDYLYVRAEWPDSTASLTRSGSWLLEDDAWRHPKATAENDKQSEDRVSFVWNISTPNFRDSFGCAKKCHGNVPGSSEFTDQPGSTMDIWHGKAARGLGLFGATDGGNLTVAMDSEAFEASAGTVSLSGVLDDKRLVWYMDVEDGYDLEDSGRRGDAGRGAYAHNRNDDKSGPLFIETAPESWADAMVLTENETTDGSVIVADPTDAAYDADAVTAAWENYVALGAVVPERILRQPEGSRADVIHSAIWQDGVWVNEMRRALVTGNDDDVQFDLASSTDYEFSVAVFDNCGRGEIPPGHTTYGDGQYQVLHFE